MISIKNISSAIFVSLIVLLIASGCAQTGSGALVGGEKDVAPPVILESTPQNYSTNFSGQDYEFVFDEYFELKDIKQKLLVSPPMEDKPEIKIKGKKLLIHFPTELLPDRTYTLNFGDALVDRNESNPLENFKVIFSTGNEIDSLQIKGNVVDAFTGIALKGVAVMLYSSSEDSLPLSELPLYLSITDEEGNFDLQNLAEGQYKIFALVDGNNNYLFDQPTESVAFSDSLVSAKSPVKTEDLRPERQDSITKTEDLRPKRQDSITKTEDLRPKTEDLRPEMQDSIPETQDTTQVETLTKEALQLFIFQEYFPNQYISGTERKRAEKVQITFNEPLDSLTLKMLYVENNNENYLTQWSENKDTVVCWMMDSLLADRDSLVYEIGYSVYDSLEQIVWEIDTIRFNFKHTAAIPEEATPMTLKGNLGRTKELGLPLILSCGLPYKVIDTSKISLFRLRDSLEFQEDFKTKPILDSSFIPGIVIKTRASQQVEIQKVFLPDSSYSLRILPGAFVGYFGETNDSLNLDFKVNNEESYGVLILNLDNIHEPAILQLLNAKDIPIFERQLSSASSERFPLLQPGKYKFKLILDKNNNGKWDTGRYLKKIQPEPIFLYDKEITLKANWEMEENWDLPKRRIGPDLSGKLE